MITVRLIGGLGNQLFQYAIGRYLANKHRAPLRLDAREFETYHLHRYSLDNFSITARIANNEDFAGMGILYTNPIIRRIARKLNIFHFGRVVIERSFDFNPIIRDLPDNVYLDGYWQSEKYFLDIRDILLREISLKEKLTGINGELERKIIGSNSVSIHIRRGDYVTDSAANKIHGVVSLEYYARAIKIFTDKFKDIHFFIFSDDPEWVKGNLNISNPHTFIDGNGAGKNYIDLHLMSLCKHNIIANSSFSWWGAWLNKNQNKIVIAPKNWFANLSRSSDDIIPSTWVKI